MERIKMDKTIPIAHQIAATDARNRWLEILNSSKIDSTLFENRDTIVKTVCDKEYGENPKKRDLIIKRKWLEVIGYELIQWAETCELSPNLTADMYSEERCAWTWYSTVDRIKAACPNSECSVSERMCFDCLTSYVLDYWNKIPQVDQMRYIELFGSLTFSMIACWICYQHGNYNNPEESIAMLHEILLIPNLMIPHHIRGTHSIECNIFQFCILTGCTTGFIEFLGWQDQKLIETSINVATFMFNNYFERSYAIEYLFMLAELDPKQQRMFIHEHIINEYEQWHDIFQQSMKMRWKLFTTKTHMFIFGVKILFTPTPCKINLILKLFNDAKTDVKLNAIPKLIPFFVALLSEAIEYEGHEKFDSKDIIIECIRSYGAAASKAIKMMCKNENYITCLMRNGALDFVSTLVKKLKDDEKSGAQSFEYVAKQTAFKTLNRIMQVNRKGKLIDGLLPWVFPNASDINLLKDAIQKGNVKGIEPFCHDKKLFKYITAAYKQATRFP